MISIKHLLLLSVICCSAAIFADEKAEIKKIVETGINSAGNMDWERFKQLCSYDYVKVPENRKVFDRKLLDKTAIYFARIQDPGLTFSELAKLNFTFRGQQVSDEQLANYRKLDSTERGKAMVKQAQAQLQTTRNNLKKVINEVQDKYQYGDIFIEDDLAVLFYKLDYIAKIKGVLVLRKENNQWKLYREFSSMDSGKNASVAKQDEVKIFANKMHRSSRNFASFMDLLKGHSTDSVAVFADGKIMDYQQAEKFAKFHDMLANGTPTMAESAPLFMEAYGKKVTPEMLAHFADQDKSGKGREWVTQYQTAMQKYRNELKNTPGNYVIKHIFVFEDCALLIDSWDLPNAGRMERVALIKKEQGKYLIYRAVSRKI